VVVISFLVMQDKIEPWQELLELVEGETGVKCNAFEAARQVMTHTACSMTGLPYIQCLDGLQRGSLRGPTGHSEAVVGNDS
jgi:hypothetical protein